MSDPSSRHELRDVMAAYPTGVTVVAATDDTGTPYGLTVNSFTSVSLDPPLVLVCIGHASSSHDRLVSGGGFAVNILSAEQDAVAMRFAREPSEGRFDEIGWELAPSGSPILEAAAAWLDCTLAEVLTAGDHSILIGRVQACAAEETASLVFHRGRLGSTEG